MTRAEAFRLTVERADAAVAMSALVRFADSSQTS
jgi:hypothetical protein